MRKKAFYALMAAIMIANTTGCADIKPDSVKDGKYSTQTPMTSLEYSIYMNKQITVFTNQLSTRLGMIANLQESNYENESYLTEQCIQTLKDTLEEVTVTKPSQGKDDTREATMTAMETAIKHLELYKKSLDENGDITSYENDFQNDFNELTGLANLYNQ